MKDKVICPICKELHLKSLVYPIDWSVYFKTMGGYYDENGNFVETNIVPFLRESFWCSNGHSWFRTTK